MIAFYAPNPVAGQENLQVKKEITSNKVRVSINMMSGSRVSWCGNSLGSIYKLQGSMSVTSTDNGDHWVCVSLDSTEFALPDGAKMVRAMEGWDDGFAVQIPPMGSSHVSVGLLLVLQRFTLKIAMGTSLQEYQDLAKKSHMDGLHLEILKLRDRVGAIQRTQDYAKVRLYASACF